MNVTTSPVALPQYACLIQNLGPDTLYLAEPTVSVGAGVQVLVDQAVTIGASNSVMYAVSEGTSDVRILGEGLGMFS